MVRLPTSSVEQGTPRGKGGGWVGGVTHLCGLNMRKETAWHARGGRIHPDTQGRCKLQATLFVARAGGPCVCQRSTWRPWRSAEGQLCRNAERGWKKNICLFLHLFTSIQGLWQGMAMRQGALSCLMDSSRSATSVCALSVNQCDSIRFFHGSCIPIPSPVKHSAASTQWPRFHPVMSTVG